jgi:hypothetical protein
MQGDVAWSRVAGISFVDPQGSERHFGRQKGGGRAIADSRQELRPVLGQRNAETLPAG